MFSTSVLLFSCLDPYRQTILPWWQRARRKLRERAWRIMGFVEVDDYFAVCAWRIGVKITPSTVSFFPAGLIGKDDEQLLRAFFEHGIDSKPLSVSLEGQRARRGHIIKHSQHICYWNE